MESAIYCRVSTEEQAAEGFSIRAQEQKLKEYANIKEWSIYNLYMDEGISGKNITERPAINRMIEDIKAGHIKNVIVFKLDRLTRSVGDLVYLIDLFKENNCDFNSLTESIDTSTASGRMFIKIIGIFAEFERENIGERVRVGRERKTREGYTIATKFISYGYDRAIGERIQTINEEQAQNVRLVFDMYVNQGMSLSAISRNFNMQGIKSKGGYLWNAASIKAILTNCNHIGNVRYCMDSPERYIESEGKHEPIISEELYNAAQILIKKNGRTAPTKKPAERNYFVNFLFCPNCGERYHPHNVTYQTQSGKKIVYVFQCRTRSLKGDCKTMSVTAKRVETALIEYFSTYSDSFNSDCETATLFETEKQNALMQLQNYKEQLKNYDEKEKEVMNHYIKGTIDFDSYRNMKIQLDSDREYIKKEIEKLAINEDDTEIILNREEIAASFKDSWQGLTDNEKRLFLTNYIKKIFVVNEPIEGSRNGNTKVVDVEFNAY
jgi:site-specific DNA recombinase